MTHLTIRNGLTLAYVVALTNAALTLVISFGVHMTSAQQAAIVAFVNIAVMLAARVLHLPERTPDGGTIAVRHEPILEKSPPDSPPEVPPVLVP